jgi:creatinine amidohydrolase/Fe(II)-dependent formamide hydrolase-like protein
MAHACELETSIYLAIDPDAVAMGLAVDERSYPEGEHAWLDWSDGPLKQGWALLEAAVAECVAYVDELVAKPLPGRRRPAAGNELLPERRPPTGS